MEDFSCNMFGLHTQAYVIVISLHTFSPSLSFDFPPPPLKQGRATATPHFTFTHWHTASDMETNPVLLAERSMIIKLEEEEGEKAAFPSSPHHRSYRIKPAASQFPPLQPTFNLFLSLAHTHTHLHTLAALWSVRAQMWLSPRELTMLLRAPNYPENKAITFVLCTQWINWIKIAAMRRFFQAGQVNKKRWFGSVN